MACVGLRVGGVDARRDGSHTWRIVASTVVIVSAAYFASAGWNVVQDQPTTYAGVFAAPVVDLELRREGGGSVHGFIGATNAAPGDRFAGALRVIGHNVTDPATYDLDFDLRIDERLPVGGARLDDALVVRVLRYGSDDLLSGADGGRNLTRDIDGNALVGNGDGKLTLGELQMGANDLPPPVGGEGTRFAIELEFAPASSGTFPGSSVRVSFVFRLGDRADADLN